MIKLDALFQPLVDLCSLKNVSWIVNMHWLLEPIVSHRRSNFIGFFFPPKHVLWVTWLYPSSKYCRFHNDFKVWSMDCELEPHVL